MRYSLLTKTSILCSAKKRKIKSSLWLHRPKKTPKLSTVKESEVVATPVQTKNVLIKPNSTELKRAPLKKKRKINEVKNSALYNAEDQILLFISDMEIDISNRCFCPIVTVTYIFFKNVPIYKKFSIPAQILYQQTLCFSVKSIEITITRV